MSGKRSKRPSCTSCAAVREAQPMTPKMTRNTKHFRIENMNDPHGESFARIINGRENHFDKRDCISLQPAASNTNCVSRVLRIAGGTHRLLANARSGQHFVKGCICAEFCQQRIGKQIRMRAIVLLDRALEQMESRLFLATIRKKRSLVIPRLR